MLTNTYESGAWVDEYPESGYFKNESGAWVNQNSESGYFKNESGAWIVTESGAKILTDVEEETYGIDQGTYDTLANVTCPAGCYNVFAAGEELNPAFPPCFQWDDPSQACVADSTGSTDYNALVKSYLDKGVDWTTAIMQAAADLKGAGTQQASVPAPNWYSPNGFRWEYALLGVAGLAAVFFLARKS